MAINKNLTAFTLRSHGSLLTAALTSAACTVAVGAGFMYYFDYSLNRSPGWHTNEEGTYYIIRTTHERAKGLKLINNASYLFDEDGIVLKGWQTFDGNTYYFDQMGVMQKGIIKIDGEEYYFSDESGIFKTGLHDFNGKEYCFNDHGFPDTGFQNDGKYYYSPTGERILGLAEINGYWYYFYESGEKEGQRASGFTEIDGNTYYFADDGHMVTGKTVINGELYDFQSNGIMFTGWTKDDSGKFFMHADEKTGVFAQGFVTIDGKDYYFDQDHHMVKGWQMIAGDNYHFDDVGVMTVGWFTDNGNKYYFNADGKAAKGFIKEGYDYYYFGDSNKLCYGWYKFGGQLYYFGTDGKVWQGFYEEDGDVYYFDQKTHQAAEGLTHTLPYNDQLRADIKQFRSDYKLMQKAQSAETDKKIKLTEDEKNRLRELEHTYLSDSSYEANVITAYNKLGDSLFYQHFFGSDHIIRVGWQKISGFKFYFDPVTGEKMTGWQTINGKKYYLGQFGLCVSGKCTVDGQEYEFNKDGSLPAGITKTDDGVRCAEGNGWVANDFRTEKNKTYYFDENGYAVTGWREIGGSMYCFNSSGVLQTGIQKDGSAIYYITTNGSVKNKWVSTDSDTTYYFGSDGIAVAGWTEIEGILYYFGSDAKLKNGWTTIDGKTYYLEKGAQLRGPFTLGGVKYIIGDAGYAKEGWTTWNTQRYYTTASGIAFTDTVLEIDGVTYNFDSNGVATVVSETPETEE